MYGLAGHGNISLLKFKSKTNVEKIFQASRKMSDG
jgi:hypothetical protein